MKELKFNDPDYLGRFLWCLIAFGLLFSIWSRHSEVHKPIKHYAVDDSPTYLVWYAVEAFPKCFQRR